MKKLRALFNTILCVFLSVYALTSHAQAIIGGGALGNPNALLELRDFNNTETTKGLLLPRVKLVALTDPSPMTEHVQGMHVYNTTENEELSPGEYYNDGTRWGRLHTSGGKQELYLQLTSEVPAFSNPNAGASMSTTFLPGLEFTAQYKGTYLIITKTFMNVKKHTNNDVINWYTSIFRYRGGVQQVSQSETYRYTTNGHKLTADILVTDYRMTHVDFFIIQLEAGDVVKASIRLPGGDLKHTFSISSSWLDRNNMSVIKIY